MFWSDQLLHRAEEIVTDFGWTSKFYAVNEAGSPVPAGSRDAVAFCIVGALQRAAYEMGAPTWESNGCFQQAITRLERAIEIYEGVPVPLTAFNDMASTTLGKVKNVYALATALDKSLVLSA